MLLTRGWILSILILVGASARALTAEQRSFLDHYIATRTAEIQGSPTLIQQLLNQARYRLQQDEQTATILAPVIEKRMEKKIERSAFLDKKISHLTAPILTPYDVSDWLKVAEPSVLALCCRLESDRQFRENFDLRRSWVHQKIERTKKPFRKRHHIRIQKGTEG